MLNTIKKAFTVWVADQIATDCGGTISEQPFVCHVDAASGADIYAEALKAYRRKGGYPEEGWQQYAEACGAYVYQVVAGHVPFSALAINHDGYHPDELNEVFESANSDPFAETYKTAWISTAHIKPATLVGLNGITENRDLPYWIHQTLYGWILRFDALDACGSLEEEGAAAHWISQQPDLMEIKGLLSKHGYQAAHLDQDGPVIEGLTEYDY